MAFPIYFDDDSQGRLVVAELRRQGHECHVSRAEGTESYADAEHLAFATAHGWVVATRNRRDFLVRHSRLLAEGGSHAGIVLIEQTKFYSVGEELRRFTRLLAARDAASMRDAVEWLNSWGGT